MPRALWGFRLRHQAGQGWMELPVAIALPPGRGVDDGWNEPSGHCPRELAGRLYAGLSIGAKRGSGGREPAGMASVIGLVDRM